MQQKIIILDFGSQTTQLIGRRVRELDTFCEILPYNKFPVGDESVIGVILSGSPYSVHDLLRSICHNLWAKCRFWAFVMAPSSSRLPMVER